MKLLGTLEEKTLKQNFMHNEVPEKIRLDFNMKIHV